MTANTIPESGEFVARPQTPSLAAFSTASPALTLARGKAVADAAAPVIKELNLVKKIHQSFHVYFDGWTMVGAMVGVFPVTVRTWEIGQGEGYGANVEARTLGGEVVGAADAIVMRDEEVGGRQKWLDAPTFQVVSMVQTRAGGKALRQPLGWIMRLAGYEVTPAEEMDEAAAARGETVSGGKGVRAGWRDIGEQNNAHQRLNVFVANNGLGEWVGMWLDSKGYSRPLSKPQMADLRRAVDRELEERQTADPGTAAAPHRPAGSAPTSEGPATRTDEAPGQPGRHRGRPSDLNASATEPGDTDVSAGHEPLNAEAATYRRGRTVESEHGTAPSPASPGDGGDDKAGRGPKAGRAKPGKADAPSDSPPAAPTQAALVDGPEPPGWEQHRNVGAGPERGG